jgi:hypothetical protein
MSKEYACIALAAEQQRHACFIPDSLALLMLLLCCRLVGTPIYFGLQLVELVVSWSAAAACAQRSFMHSSRQHSVLMSLVHRTDHRQPQS